MLLLALATALAAPPEAPVRLDAGTWASPRMDGFDLLHLEGATDGRVRWSRPPRRARVTVDPDPLAGDGLEGGVVHLDLAPGTWTAWVMLGSAAPDPAYRGGLDAFGLRVDGEDALVVSAPEAWTDWLTSPFHATAPVPAFLDAAGDPTSAFQRQVLPAHPWRRVDLEVDEDGVDVEAFGLPLQALVAVPSAERVQGAAALAVVDARREDWWRDHLHPDVPPPVPADPGCLAPLEAPLADCDAPSTLHLGRDDRAAYQLVGDAALAPAHRRGRRAWVPGPPPGVHVEVSEVSWLDASGHPTRALRPRPTVWWPDAEPMDQGLPRVRGVVVHTTADAPSGRWELRLTDDTVLPLEVHPVALPEGPPMGLFLQVDTDAVQRTGFASDTVHDLLDQHLELLAQRGLRAVSVRFTLWPDRWEEADLTTARHALARWSALGGRVFDWPDAKQGLRQALWIEDDGPPIRPEHEALVPRLFALDEGRGLRPWFHVWEEEDWKQLHAVERAPEATAALRALAPEGAQLLATTATAAGWPVAEHFDVITVTGEGAELLAGVREARVRGARPVAYNLAPGTGGPLLAWAVGSEGLLQWHASPDVADPFHHVRARPRWFHTVLGPDGRHHATTPLEAFADGVALVRLLALAEARLPTLRGRARDETAAVVGALRAALLGAHASPAEDGRLLDPSVRSALRARLLPHLAR